MNKLLLLTLCLLAINVSGQETKKDFFNSKKIAFISNEMSLTVKEAQQFWPLYNEKSNKISTIKKKIKHEQSKLIFIINSSKYEEKSDQITELKFNIAEIQKEYYYKYKYVISSKKINQLYIAEEKFTSYLLKELNKKRVN